MAKTYVYFATNRRGNKDKDPTEFTDEFAPDLDSIRLGWVEFEEADIDVADNDVAAMGKKGTVYVAPENLDNQDATRSKVGSKEIFANIRKDMRAGCDALLYVHGYNYTFRESVARAAQVRKWLDTADNPLVVLMFAWPSLGRGITPKLYTDERRRAEASGVAMGRAILKATDFIRATARDERCKGSVHLLAHSMGNWTLRGAVQHMRTFVGENIPPLFDEVILTAADEDDDALSQKYKLAPLLNGSRRVTVYYNHVDAALKASDWAMGNPDRLGRSGPNGAGALKPKVEAVNVYPVVESKDDATLHQYYRLDEEVRRDMAEVLSGVPAAAMELPHRRVNLGDHWALRAG